MDKKTNNYDCIKSMSLEEMAVMITMLKVRAVEKTFEKLGMDFKFEDSNHEKLLGEVRQFLESEVQGE